MMTGGFGDAGWVTGLGVIAGCGTRVGFGVEVRCGDDSESRDGNTGVGFTLVGG